MLSIPTPPRPINFRFGHPSISSLRTLVALRTVMASYAGSCAASSSWGICAVSTVNPASSSSCLPNGSIPSFANIFISFNRCRLFIFFFRFLHGVYQCIHAGNAQRVINRCAEATNTPVSFQAHQVPFHGQLQESTLMGLVFRHKSHVHPRTICRLGGPPKQWVAINFIIQSAGLNDIFLLDDRYPALVFQPTEIKHSHING